ncbi:hypothetical protein BCR34DRAFT_591643 [Clohesyomyces aquaticus]|uniref:Uncharacterized protein n=1 Tax=Clohesyomyces aquaticus TaxID=1231657 RepID=A0A1Y1YZ48_9PLEO|nr:hypothetical protein BCR34DRAFT_591643 [Clohesyomyces aquaticus]
MEAHLPTLWAHILLRLAQICFHIESQILHLPPWLRFFSPNACPRLQWMQVSMLIYVPKIAFVSMAIIRFLDDRLALSPRRMREEDLNPCQNYFFTRCSRFHSPLEYGG